MDYSKLGKNHFLEQATSNWFEKFGLKFAICGSPPRPLPESTGIRLDRAVKWRRCLPTRAAQAAKVFGANPRNGYAKPRDLYARSGNRKRKTQQSQWEDRATANGRPSNRNGKTNTVQRYRKDANVSYRKWHRKDLGSLTIMGEQRSI